MNGYDAQSLAYMAKARTAPPQRAPQPVTDPQIRPREAVNSNITESISSDDLAFLLQYFAPRDDRHMGGHSMDNDWDDWDSEMCEAPLNAKRRNALSSTKFAFPEDRSYPIDTPARARSALSRGQQFLPREKYVQLVRKVKSRYPDMDVTATTK